jgi:hypothetical protein
VLTHGELLLNKDLTIQAVGHEQATISGPLARRCISTQRSPSERAI